MSIAEARYIAELEEEVAFLKQALGAVISEHRVATLKSAFGLTRKEAEILLLLYERPRVLSKQAILSAIWGYDTEIEIKIVDVLMCKTRKKIGFSAIETIWGMGYRLAPEGVQLVKEQLDKAPQ